VKVAHKILVNKYFRMIELSERRGRRCEKLLSDLKEKKEYRTLKEEALDRTLWRCERGNGPVLSQTK